MAKSKIKLLIVDDSAVVRQTLSKLLEDFPLIGNIEFAANPVFAFKKIEENRPDVIISDIEMPQMDGLTFLEKIMATDPIPVIICSSHSEKGSKNSIRALQLGAVDIIEKPKFSTKTFLEESQIIFQDAIRAASFSRVAKKNFQNHENYKSINEIQSRPNLEKPIEPKPIYSSNSGIFNSRNLESAQPKYTADVILDYNLKTNASIGVTERIICIGSSTGGTEALRQILPQFPKDTPGILIVQHMPEKFTESFAMSLDKVCEMEVKEANDNDEVYKGRILIAPGGKHMLLKRVGTKYFVEVKEGPLVSRHRPSVDVLFRSCAKFAGRNSIGVIMTGMGYDGAQGMLELKQSGAYTIAQDEKTSVVYGMPGEAVKKGGVDTIEPLGKIPQVIMSVASRHPR